MFRSRFVLLALVALAALVLVAAPLAGATARRPAARVTVTRPPYLLFPGDPSRMRVLWQLSGSAASTLAWGPDSSCSRGRVLSAEYGRAHMHAATLRHLAPATRYFYRVVTGERCDAGSFVSAPAPGATRLRFFAYGDTRSQPLIHDRVAQRMVEAYRADPRLQTMALFMGDFVAPGDRDSVWSSEFFTPAAPHLRELLAHVPLQATIGNHDVGTPSLFARYFPYPWVADHYWSFDYGPVHVAVVDEYANWLAGSAQLAWLARDLAATTKRWKFVMLHEPGWSDGVDHANVTGVQNFIQPLCQKYGVAILFAGHNHNYCRALVDDVVHVTTGGGGAPLTEPKPAQPFVIRAVKAYHYCVVSIDGDALHLDAIDAETGAVIDSFTLARRAGPNEPATHARGARRR